MQKFLLTMLKGKGTYTAAGLLALFAVIGLYLGQLDQEKTVELILEALAIAGLRRAIK